MRSRSGFCEPRWLLVNLSVMAPGPVTATTQAGALGSYC